MPPVLDSPSGPKCAAARIVDFVDSNHIFAYAALWTPAREGRPC